MLTTRGVHVCQGRAAGPARRSLDGAVVAFPQARLQKPILPNGSTAAYLVRGIAAHDLYHAGQIALLKRMVKSR
ncbi:MAG: hypothetical protein U0Q55_01035 [Vicinamibacterales bacterium]